MGQPTPEQIVQSLRRREAVGLLRAFFQASEAQQRHEAERLLDEVRRRAGPASYTETFTAARMVR